MKIYQKYLIKERAGSMQDLYSLDETAYLAKMDDINKELEKSQRILKGGS